MTKDFEKKNNELDEKKIVGKYRQIWRKKNVQIDHEKALIELKLMELIFVNALYMCIKFSNFIGFTRLAFWVFK